MNKQEHPGCSLKESVTQSIHLMVVTRFGEFKYDENYGFELWEHDFENITNSQAFKDLVRQSLKKVIDEHEPRLSKVRVDVQMEQVEYKVSNRRTKIRISLMVSGVLTKTNENFQHAEKFFIGPLSYF